ncbi:MAG: preprotein translocase subunit SecG [Burkholderiales bacterium]|nr:preprotein translocase subunit SecG [Burkholderiales bacterium]
MELIKSLFHIINVLSALSVIVLVLLQHGKGADMGAAFGSGSAGSLFGSSGSANFLSRTTAVCAIIFFCSLFGLVWMDNHAAAAKGDIGVMSTVQQKAPEQGTQKPPAAPAQNDKQGSIPN